MELRNVLTRVCVRCLRVAASMFEIYNEEIKDLLGNGKAATHKIQHDAKGNTVVTELKVLDVSDAEQVLLPFPTRKAKLPCILASTTTRTGGSKPLNPSSIIFWLNISCFDGVTTFVFRTCVGKRSLCTRSIEHSKYFKLHGRLVHRTMCMLHNTKCTAHVARYVVRFTTNFEAPWCREASRCASVVSGMNSHPQRLPPSISGASRTLDMRC